MYIKNIRIKNFRSIWDEEIKVNDLTILVGWNDAWKSNYLKALNLFFNWETDFKTKFNFEADLNKFAAFWAKKAKEIEITIEFQPPSNYSFPSLKWFPEPKLKWRKVWRYGWIIKEDDFIIDSKKYFTFEEYKEALKNDKIPFKSKIPEWLRNIKYRYIPAVKSNDYFSALLRELYQVLSEANITWIQVASQSLIKTVNNDTSWFKKWVKKYLWVDSEISLPQDLWWLFESLDILTGHFGKKMPLNSRWDWIKTRHIPSLIKYFAEEVNRNRYKWSPKIDTIWWYEEPENNIEMSRAFELADEFKKYTDEGIQVFLTTHSPAFYNLIQEENEDNIIGYHIEQDNSHLSKSRKIKLTNDLDEKLWILGIITPHISAAKKEIEEIKKERVASNSRLVSLEESLNRLKPKKILIIEDSKEATLSLWNKWMESLFDNNEVVVWSSNGWNKFDIETAIIHMQNIDQTYSPHIFREIDRDWYSDEQISVIEDYFKEKMRNKWLRGKYKFRVLPVCEIENFAILDTHPLPDDLDELKDHLRKTIMKHFDEIKGTNLWDTLEIKYDATHNTWICSELVIKAKSNPRKYLPWDKILPSSISILQSSDISDLRPELVEYLAEIKDFFES